MPYKFKVGDRVKVVRLFGVTGAIARRRIGEVGTVRRHVADFRYPYEVIGKGWSCVCVARELEAAPAKKTRKKRGK